MKVQYGAIIVDGRGKLGGHVGQRNTYGNFLRTKVTPVNKQSYSQQNHRSRVAELTRNWSVLTNSERNAWYDFAINNPVTDVFGNTMTLSGFNMYVKVNLNLINIGEERVTRPGLQPGIIQLIYNISLPPDRWPSSIIVFNWEGDIVATTKVAVFTTAPVSAGISSGGSAYRQIAILDSSATSPYSLTAQYKAKFGFVGFAGSKIFTKAIQIDIGSGLAYSPLIASNIVADSTPP